MGKDLLNKEQVLALADSPSRDVLPRPGGGHHRRAPAQLVTWCSARPSSLVTCLSQIQDKKEKAA